MPNRKNRRANASRLRHGGVNDGPRPNLPFWLSEIFERDGPTPSYEKRVVAYMDILGWKAAVSDPEQRKRVDYTALFLNLMSQSFTKEHIAKLKISADEPTAEEHIPFGLSKITREFADKMEKIRVSVFSDCVAISSPPEVIYQTFSLVNQFCQVVMKSGFLYRGAISFGEMHHDYGTVYGPALNEVASFDRSGAPPGIVCTESFLDVLKATPNEHDVVTTFTDQQGRTVLFPFAFSRTHREPKLVLNFMNDWRYVMGGLMVGIDTVKARLSAAKTQDETNRISEVQKKWFYMRDMTQRMIGALGLQVPKTEQRLTPSGTSP